MFDDEKAIQQKDFLTGSRIAPNLNLAKKVWNSFTGILSFFVSIALCVCAWGFLKEPVPFTPDGSFERPFLVDGTRQKQTGKLFYVLKKDEPYDISPNISVTDTSDEWVFTCFLNNERTHHNTINVKKTSSDAMLPSNAWMVNENRTYSWIMRYIRGQELTPYLYIPGSGWIFKEKNRPISFVNEYSI